MASVDFPRAVRPDDGQRLAERTLDVHPRQRIRRCAGIAERDALGHDERLAGSAARGAAGPAGGWSGHPDARFGELRARARGRPRAAARRPPRRRRPRAPRLDRPAPPPRPPGARRGSRRARPLEDAVEHFADLAPRPPDRGWRSARRAGAGPGAAPACRPGPAAAARRRTARGSAGRGVRELDRRQRGVDARPDRVGRDASVLEAEGDVVAGPAHHELRLGILEQQPGAVARRARVAPVHEERALGLGAAAGIDQARRARRAASTCRRRTARAAARARRARSVRSTPRSAQSRRPGVAQAPPARLDPRRAAACRSWRHCRRAVRPRAARAPPRTSPSTPVGDERAQQQPRADAGDDRAARNRSRSRRRPRTSAPASG